MDLVGVYHLYEIGGKKNQEDYIWPAPGNATLNDRVFIVCDGVGGSENGEIASRLISEFIARQVVNYSEAEMSSALINELLEEGRRKLMKYSADQGLNDDMATTFSLLILYDQRAFIAWCGDTRVYHLRHGSVLYKTEDHSLVNTLVKEGEITDEEARLHPQKNIILRAIKADGSPIDAEGYWVNEVQDGDYFMLCTDGILENVTDADIKFLLNQNDKGKINLVKSFQQFCFNKTRDNYSMYLVKIRMAKKRKSSGAGVGYLIFFLLLILSSVLFAIYYSQSKKKLENLKPANRSGSFATDSDQVPAKDSLPYVEFEKNEKIDSGQSLITDTVKKKVKTR
ncbi:MAG: protein phosphatase 2C domain-containing protein [Bacteroidota bacterium]|nr:protein phosphatase 2C domain-containing protein [Bacteroidota bacterium]